MAIAIVAPAQSEVGQIIKVTGTGFTLSGSVKIAAANEESNGGLELAAGVLAADGAGAFDSTGKIDFIPLEEGHVDITVTDVAAATKATARVQVFRAS